jgi:hypothetical protein
MGNRVYKSSTTNTKYIIDIAGKLPTILLVIDTEASSLKKAYSCANSQPLIQYDGRPTTKLPKTKYRREMRTDFDKEKYGQRWQVETVFSMIKRNFGSALRAKRYWSQCREMMLMVLTHNLAVILFVKELFYRACRTPLIIPCGLLYCRCLFYS